MFDRGPVSEDWVCFFAGDVETTRSIGPAASGELGVSFLVFWIVLKIVTGGGGDPFGIVKKSMAGPKNETDG